MCISGCLLIVLSGVEKVAAGVIRLYREPAPTYIYIYIYIYICTNVNIQICFGLRENPTWLIRSHSVAERPRLRNCKAILPKPKTLNLKP